MSARKDNVTKFLQARRSTPFELGKAAYVASRSLKGLPYGPGWRQGEFIRGFQTAAGVVA